MTAYEARIRGTHQALTPVVDVARDARWGRVEETYGEDPYLTTRMGVAFIKTLQEREWIRVVGHRDVPGRPAMLATTKAFLDHFNLKGLDDLPTLAALRELEPEPLLAFDEDLPVPAGTVGPAVVS